MPLRRKRKPLFFRDGESKWFIVLETDEPLLKIIKNIYNTQCAMQLTLVGKAFFLTATAKYSDLSNFTAEQFQMMGKIVVAKMLGLTVSITPKVIFELFTTSYKDYILLAGAECKKEDLAGIGVDTVSLKVYDERGVLTVLCADKSAYESILTFFTESLARRAVNLLSETGAQSIFKKTHFLVAINLLITILQSDRDGAIERFTEFGIITEILCREGGEEAVSRDPRINLTLLGERAVTNYESYLEREKHSFPRRSGWVRP